MSGTPSKDGASGGFIDGCRDRRRVRSSPSTEPKTREFPDTSPAF
jgi:hypothetical protein